MDGKHHTEIVKDIQSGDYDLIVMGALGSAAFATARSARSASA